MELARWPLLPDPWLPLDLSRPPEPPEWLVPDYLARGWITLDHGREGSGKSVVYQAIVAAALTGAPFLGRKVNINRILVIDEENPVDVVNSRLKAMGYDHAQHRGRLLYFSQIGCRLGEGTWGDQLLAIAEDFGPDLVVIDSMSSATVATWGNETITPLFASVFRPLVKAGRSLLLNHHDRKAGGEIQDRASGGTQWLAQVDRQIAFEKVAPIAVEELDDGAVRLRFPIKIAAGKARQGKPFPDTYVSVLSESEPQDHDRLRKMWLEEAAPPAAEGKTLTRPTWYMERFSRAIEDKPGPGYGEACKAIGKAPGTYARKAMDLLIEEGYVRIEPDGQRQRHHSIKPYRADDDPLSDSFEANR
jgi:AAA domain